MSGFLIAELVHSDPDVVANSYYSSQDSNYPAANAYNLDRRKRVWHSAGYWHIGVTGNTLIFREQVGVDLTATLTPGDYASQTLFFAELKTALEAAGVATYTITRTSQGKIQIASDLGGGATVFQLILTDSDSATMAGLLGFSTASDLSGASSYAADFIRYHYKERLVFDCGFPVNPTMLIATAGRNNPINISPTATIKLKGCQTNAWESVDEEFTITYRQNALVYINENGIAQVDADGYRYWALEIQDPENPDGYVELGAVALASHTAITRGCPNFPLESAYDDLSTIAYSEGGQTMVGFRDQTQSFTLSWEQLNVASFENIESVFIRFGTTSSFFIAMDQNDAFSTDGETWARLVKFARPPVARLVSPQNWSMSWQLREEL